MHQPQSWFDNLIVPFLSAVAAVILFALMALTCIDVIGRYFLNMPVYGGFELTEVMLACLIFTGLPLVTLRQEHVTVDVLDPVTPNWVLRIQHVIACLVACGATGYLGWRMWIKGGSMLASGETTAQLKLTLGWLTYGMSVMMFVTALAFLVLVLRRPRRQSAGEV